MGCLGSKSSKKQQEAASIEAAMMIQRFHRRHMARLEMRKRCTWNIFQSLEYASEQDQAELYKFFNDLLKVYPNVAKKDEHSASIESITRARLSLFKEPDSSYFGPHFKFPLGKKDIDVMIDLFRKSKILMHAKYVGQILMEASSKLKELPNLNVASTVMSKQITIVGDLHGKLDDLLVIFHKNGLPSLGNPYVFNGDFVDRGRRGIEVFLLILACFLAFPGAVYPNRGNHEDTVMNARYGFIRELKDKYKDNARLLLSYIEEVYRWLPIGTIINNKVLVVHGGISDTTNLEVLKRMQRGKYVSILRPPVVSSTEYVDKTEWQQIFDIMWSDPQDKPGCDTNIQRGAGTLFGPDVSLKFLTRFRLSYLIRSHECKAEGYEFTHDERVVTIFSASNYYAPGSNRGAFMKLNPQLDPVFVQYVSTYSKIANLSFLQKLGNIESSAFQELGVRLRERIDELESEFRKRDPHGNGYIPTSQWVSVMENISGLSLPWHLLSDKLAPGKAPDKHSNYESTMEVLNSDLVIEAAANESNVVDALYENRDSLEAIFRILDKDHSGFISLEEFADACDLLEKHLGGGATKAELLEKCKLMDINGDGFVDLNEFLEAFRLSRQTAKAKRKSQDPGSLNSLSTAASEDPEPKKNSSRLRKSDSQLEINPSDYEVLTFKPEVQKIINALRFSKQKKEK